MNNKEKKEYDESFGKSFIVGHISLICGRCEIPLESTNFRGNYKSNSTTCYGCNKTFYYTVGEEEDNEEEKD